MSKQGKTPRKRRQQGPKTPAEEQIGRPLSKAHVVHPLENEIRRAWEERRANPTEPERELLRAIEAAARQPGALEVFRRWIRAAAVARAEDRAAKKAEPPLGEGESMVHTQWEKKYLPKRLLGPGAALGREEKGFVVAAFHHAFAESERMERLAPPEWYPHWPEGTSVEQMKADLTSPESKARGEYEMIVEECTRLSDDDLQVLWRYLREIEPELSKRVPDASAPAVHEEGRSMADKPPKWVPKMAVDVHELIRKHKAVSRVREMIRRWGARWDAEGEARKQWEIKRNKHFAKLAKLPADDPLRVKADKPPKRGWKWDRSLVLEDVPKAKAPRLDGKGTMEVLTRALKWLDIRGWVPPKLLWEAAPETTFFLPLTDKPLELDEKYALLAAIHDAALRAIPKLDPWDGENDADILSSTEWMSFFALRKGVIEHVADYEAEFTIFLGDVEDDLKGQGGGQTVQSPVATERHAAATEDSDKGSANDQEAPDPPEAERSNPLSLAVMANRLGNMRPEKFKEIALENWGLKRITRQTWTVRLDLMDGNTRHKIEHGKPLK